MTESFVSDHNALSATQHYDNGYSAGYSQALIDIRSLVEPEPTEVWDSKLTVSYVDGQRAYSLTISPPREEWMRIVEVMQTEDTVFSALHVDVSKRDFIEAVSREFLDSLPQPVRHARRTASES